MLRIPVALLALAGCGRLSFDSLGDAGGGSADALACANPANHDEDGDGVDDACDVCPQFADDDNQRDTDGDGIGDRCETHDAIDHRVVFDPFTTRRAVWTPTDQDVSFLADHVIIPATNDSVGVGFDGTPLGTTYEIGGTLSGGGDGTRQFALDIGNATLGSYYCELYDDSNGTLHVQATWTTDDVTHKQAGTPMTFPGRLSSGTFRLVLDDHYPDFDCQLELDGTVYQTGGTITDTINRGEFLIAFNNIDGDVHYFLQTSEL